MIGFSKYYSTHNRGFSFQNLAETMRSHRTRRAVYERTQAELTAMTDAELTEMKIARSLIPQIARGAARSAG